MKWFFEAKIISPIEDKSRGAINNCQTFALTGVNDRICVNYTCINTHVIFCRVEDEHLTIVNCFSDARAVVTAATA